MCDEKILTPAQVCVCGSIDIDELTMGLGEDGLTITAIYECNDCCGIWQCDFSFSGVNAL